eukprot:TRINITY_DN55172_c0_g1_i1.p1 TRINITY_DN55172_c0_g1~~TRINITY_DN55172_c0_g1_i1.p1  ORF type:complete len:875 (+),score=356.39 TRINITY_DN55172_c0_g1_i1:68-2626(+)
MEGKQGRDAAAAPAAGPAAGTPAAEGDARLYHLCFDPAEFRDEEEFTPAAFLVEKRRHVPIETLRRDLETYREHLQDQVVHLVNTDVYDTFLSVTNKLRQREGELRRLQAPLPEMAHRIGAACDKLRERKDSVGLKLNELAALEHHRRFLNQKLRLRVSEHRLRKLLRDYQRGEQRQPTAAPGGNPLRGGPAGEGAQQNGVPPRDGGEDAARAPQLRLLLAMADEARQQEFDNRLWIAASEEERAERHTVSSRLAQLRETVAQKLRADAASCMRRHQRALAALRKRQQGDGGAPEPDEDDADATEALRLCLRAFSALELEGDAGQLFRKEVCDPAVEEAISYRAAQQARGSADAVRRLFIRLAELWEHRLQPVCELAAGVCKGFDLCTAVWQSVADTIGKRMLYLFENGSPLLFHQRYVAAHAFVAALQRGCPDPDARAALSSSTEMVLWRSRWNLEVYYKMREITLAKQLAQWFPPPEAWTGPCAIREVGTVPPPAAAEPEDAVRFAAGPFCFVPAAALHSALMWCISPCVFLLPLGHRFLRLCLCAALGFRRWLTQAVASHNLPVLNAAGELQAGKPQQKGAAAAGEQISVFDLTRLHADLASLRSALRDDFATAVLERFAQLGAPAGAEPEERQGEAARAVDDVLEACLSAAGFAAQEVSLSLTSAVAHQCITNLTAKVVALRAQYRMTKKAVPTKASFWASQLLKPLEDFKADLASRPDSCPKEVVDGWTAEVATMVSAKYRAAARDLLLQSWKQERQILEAKRKRGGERDDAQPGERPSTSNMTDTDKIMVQVYLDVQEFGNVLSKHGIDCKSFPPYKRLLDCVLRGAWLRAEPWVPDEPPPLTEDP